MNPEVKKLWVDALRSGKYSQGKRSLQTSTGQFCCLGVLCEVAVTEGIIGPPTPTTMNYIYDGARGFLPQSVLKWADQDSDLSRSENDLANMNDNENASFGDIAKWIEENL